MERDAGWLGPGRGSGHLQPWEGKEKGDAAAAALGSQKPSTVAGPGPGGGAQVCRSESESLARL